MNALQIRDLTKRFGSTTALDGVSLEVEEGELYGLLGINGAGKSTLIGILSGLLAPTSGSASVYGRDVVRELSEVRKLVGVSPQETAIAPNLTVEENLRFFAGIYGASADEAQARAQETARRFGLDGERKRRAKTLSGGRKRRLSIAVALIAQPKVLFLDEPTLGLDVVARRELWKIVKELKGKMTIVLTSHYLEEIEALCDRVAILSHGKTLAVGTTEELKARAGADSFEDAFIELVGEEERE
ncbi:MAG: ABC transporter ATP-binding protein [Candidatus Gallimonas sp.]